MGLFDEDPLPLPGEKPPHRDEERKKKEQRDDDEFVGSVLREFKSVFIIIGLIILISILTFSYIIWDFL